MEQHIFSSEAARTLSMGVSTLRKYAAILEASGHSFERGANNGRIFLQEDLKLISQMADNIAKEGMTIEQAAATAAGSRPQEIAATTAAASAAPEKNIAVENQGKEINQFLEKMKGLEVQQASLTEMNQALAKQVERLTEKIEERERDHELFQRLQNTRDKKKRKGIAIFRPLTILTGKK